MAERMVIAALLTFVLVCSSDAALTRSEFNRAITANGYPKPSDNKIYTYLAKATNKYPRNELAMFLAQMIHESGGFQFREEIVCAKGNHCAGQYVDNVGLPGKFYYGRGFIQLTWGANYKAASHALGLGEKLLQHPEQVASNTNYAVQVSTWYWETRVRPALKANKNKFGVTTKAINGAIECSGGYNENAARRYQIYLKVAAVLKITNKASEHGCYN